jgi:hypothetical protein
MDFALLSLLEVPPLRSLLGILVIAAIAVGTIHISRSWPP